MYVNGEGRAWVGILNMSWWNLFIIVEYILFLSFYTDDYPIQQALAVGPPYPMVVLPVEGDYWMEGTNHIEQRDMLNRSVMPRFDLSKCMVESDYTATVYRKNFLGKVCNIDAFLVALFFCYCHSIWNAEKVKLVISGPFDLPIFCCNHISSFCQVTIYSKICFF